MTGLPFPMYRPISYRQYTDSIGSVEKYWGALKQKTLDFGEKSGRDVILCAILILVDRFGCYP